MKKVILYEPSIGSNNIGDQIIVDGVKNALKNYLKDAFVIEFPTHTPLYNRYLNYIGDADMKIVCGSNIIVNRLNTMIHLRQWAVGNSVGKIGPLVFVGVGSQQYGQKISFYTQMAYKRMMKPNFLHAVRDGYTEEALKNIGITNVINTACPTMWGLTEEHCAVIPNVKSREACVFTLTDYKENANRDTKMIGILKKSYKDVYFWAQGNGDWEYFKRLNLESGIKIIAPSLAAYDEFLSEHDVDFIGTRLHGGMRAMQHRKRSIIIGVDNRAIELNKDFGVPVIAQENIDSLEEIIHSCFTTRINLPSENIKMFLQQFREG
jgi:hypothetical protein